MAMPLTLGGATWSRLLSRARCEGGPLHAAPSLVDHHGSRATVPTWDRPGGEAGTNPTHIGEAPLKPLGAAGAQQLCSTKPREPPRVGPPAPVQCPATQGLMVVVVVGIPGWHARGQGFKSPQLHHHNTAGHSSASHLSAFLSLAGLPDSCPSLAHR